jgi:hypothetical protein
MRFEKKVMDSQWRSSSSNDPNLQTPAQVLAGDVLIIKMPLLIIMDQGMRGDEIRFFFGRRG